MLATAWVKNGNIQDQQIEVNGVRLLDVLDAPVLVLLVLVGVRTDLRVVSMAFTCYVQDFTSGTVFDEFAFHCPLLGRSAVVRLQSHSFTRF